MPEIRLEGVLVDSFSGHSQNGAAWRCVTLYVPGCEHPYKFFLRGDEIKQLDSVSVGSRVSFDFALLPASKGGFFVQLKGVN